MQALSVSVNDAARAIGISRTKLYELIGNGDLKTIKIGRRTLIKTASLEALIEQEAA